MSFNLDKGMNLLEFGNMLFASHERIAEENGKKDFCLEVLVNEHPYFAFAILSIVLELFGKVLSLDTSTNIHAIRAPKQNFLHPFQDKTLFSQAVNPLSKYIYFEDLFKSLRCGFCHALMPDTGLVLSSGSNKFNEEDGSLSVVGCKSLYSDMKVFWEELKTKCQNKLQSMKAINVELNDNVV